MSRSLRLVLVGAGHTHLEVLRRWHHSPVDAQVTLVTPHASWIYSGMLPGLIAGDYEPREVSVDVAPLARHAGAVLIHDQVDALDLTARTVRGRSGSTLPFDILSLDVGSTPVGIPGTHAHVLPVKPAEAFIDAWRAWREAHVRGELGAIATVGGGVGAIEMTLAMHHALGGDRAPPPMTLVADALRVSPRAARKFRSILERRGIATAIGERAATIEGTGVVLVDGRVVPAQRVVLATGAASAPWLAASGLACDQGGFVRTTATLQSVTHSFVVASGDCGTIDGAARPKAGVFAVRAAPVLAANLRAMIDHGRLRAYHPQAKWLALVSTGERRAVAIRGDLLFSGRACWWWKNGIDRAFMRRYAPTNRAGMLDEAQD